MGKITPKASPLHFLETCMCATAQPIPWEERQKWAFKDNSNRWKGIPLIPLFTDADFLDLLTHVLCLPHNLQLNGRVGMNGRGLQSLVYSLDLALGCVTDRNTHTVGLDDHILKGRDMWYVSSRKEGIGYSTYACIFSLLAALQHHCFLPDLGPQEFLFCAGARSDLTISGKKKMGKEKKRKMGRES